VTVESTPGYFLRTERLGFRWWSNEDLPLALRLWGDIRVTRLIGGPFRETQIQERLAREIATMSAQRVQFWPVFLLADDAFVGCCGFRPHKSEERTYELGYAFLPSYWDKGLAMESARAVLSYAFDALGAWGLFAGHHPENLASQKVLEKLGFRFTHRELYPPTGKMHPTYSLTTGTPRPASHLPTG
jgi:[ribosomal protein S5]-alanine N-acetyltransferase